MKIQRIVLLVSACACLLTPSIFAADSSTPSAPSRPKHLRNGPRPNADIEAYHKLVLAIYDTDKNGVLDETEREVLRDDIDAGKMEPPPRRRGEHGRMGPPPEILAKYDADKDGTLSEAERKALEADIASGKLPPPPAPLAGGPGAGEGDDLPPPPPEVTSSAAAKS